MVLGLVIKNSGADGKSLLTISQGDTMPEPTPSIRRAELSRLSMPWTPLRTQAQL